MAVARSRTARGAVRHCLRGDAMTTSAVTLFLAILAVLAQAATAAVVLVELGRRRSSRLTRWHDALVLNIGSQGLLLGALVAATALVGSLYLSEVANFTPCQLCWYQRICMYPLAVLLGMATVRREAQMAVYAIALAALGSVISCYHILVENFPNLETSVCKVANPCTIVWVRRFGYLTIPTMALSGFLLIVGLMVLVRAAEREEHDGREPGVVDGDHTER